MLSPDWQRYAKAETRHLTPAEAEAATLRFESSSLRARARHLWLKGEAGAAAAAERDAAAIDARLRNSSGSN